MAGGSKRGERRGGRAKGTRNKATIERALVAERIIAETAAAGRKLGREVLEDFMIDFAQMAEIYKPTMKKTKKPPKNEVRYEKWARLAVQCAKDLAPYQSPTYRAVVVAPAPLQNSGQKRTRFTLTIFQDGTAQIPAPDMKTVQSVPAGP